jgi:hypothetical protein
MKDSCVVLQHASRHDCFRWRLVSHIPWHWASNWVLEMAQMHGVELPDVAKLRQVSTTEIGIFFQKASCGHSSCGNSVKATDGRLECSGPNFWATFDSSY